jgi:hypothetical protein
MKLEQFSLGLKIRVNAEVERITEEQSDILARTSQLTVVIENCIHELKQFVIKYKFDSANEEIQFFKKIKPDFAGLLRYYKKLFHIQLVEVHNSSEVRLKHFRSQLRRLEVFMKRNDEYYQYILSNLNHMDEKYFTRGNALPNTAVIDDRFSTPHEIRLSKIICNEKVRTYLTNAIQSIENPGSTSTNSPLTWTGSKTDLIELIYALQAAGVFNKKEAEVKQIATHLEKTFNVTLGNYYRIFQDIKLRKTGQVNFLNQLRNLLIERIREADSK